jgi:hypothetical protein
MRKNMVYILIAIVIITSTVIVFMPHKTKAMSPVGSALYLGCLVDCHDRAGTIENIARIDYYNSCSLGCAIFFNM